MFDLKTSESLLKEFSEQIGGPEFFTKHVVITVRNKRADGRCDIDMVGLSPEGLEFIKKLQTANPTSH